MCFGNQISEVYGLTTYLEEIAIKTKKMDSRDIAKQLVYINGILLPSICCFASHNPASMAFTPSPIYIFTVNDQLTKIASTGELTAQMLNSCAESQIQCLELTPE